MSSRPSGGSIDTETLGLQRLLHPHDTKTFFATYIGEQMLHVDGDRHRWDSLFSWCDLNRVLNQGLISHPHARLVRDGGQIDPKLYTHEVGGRRWLSGDLCHRQMAQGATLIVDALERVAPALETFIRQLERDLQSEAHVDLVATCAIVPGLRMHWDDSECFNIQLDGEKRWEVLRPLRPYPLTPSRKFPARRDVEQSSAPSGPPTWSAIVRPGDMIYLPRGWWHNVTPQVPPSLHLSISVDIPTVSDFVAWLAQHAARHAVVRRILPSWASDTERREFLEEALAALNSCLSIETMSTFLDQVDSAAADRAPFALPADALSTGGQTLTSAMRIRLRSTKALDWRVVGELLQFEWQGNSYVFNAKVLPALQRLDKMNAFTLAQLSEGLDPLLVRGFAMALLAAGMLSVISEPPEAALTS